MLNPLRLILLQILNPLRENPDSAFDYSHRDNINGGINNPGTT